MSSASISRPPSRRSNVAVAFSPVLPVIVCTGAEMRSKPSGHATSACRRRSSRECPVSSIDVVSTGRMVPKSLTASACFGVGLVVTDGSSFEVRAEIGGDQELGGQSL